MSEKKQTSIDLQGNSIENGSFERLTTPPTEDNFIGRQIELDGVPHFYNGKEFESFWRGKKANAENGVYELDINTPYPDSLYSLIIAKYGRVDDTREIKLNVFVSFCAISLYGNWPRNIRYNIHIQSFIENSIEISINSIYSINANDYLKFSLSKQFSVISSSFINVLGLSNPVFAGIPVPEALDNKNFWVKDKANAENLLPVEQLTYDEWRNFSGLIPFYYEKYIQNGKPLTRSVVLNTWSLNYPVTDGFEIGDIIGNVEGLDLQLIEGVRLDFYLINHLYGSGAVQTICNLYFPTNGSAGLFYFSNVTDIVTRDNKQYFRVKYLGLLKISIFYKSGSSGIFIYVHNLDGGSSTFSTALAKNRESTSLIKEFCLANNLYLRDNTSYNDSVFFDSIDLFTALINKINQLSGGGGATGDFWSLLKANSEVSTALFKPLNTDTGVFAHLYADSNLDESRDIIIDFSTYAGGRVFTDFFSAYNLDNNNFPYSWTETNENSEKMKYVRYKMLLCNNPYTYPIAICVPDNPNIITNFSEVMTGLTYPNETQARYFYLYPNQSVNVDFELIYLTGAEQPILAVININSFTGTATFDTQRTSSTDNATVISNYLTSNNIPCTVDKVTGQTLYNVQDLLANIITQINS